MIQSSGLFTPAPTTADGASSPYLAEAREALRSLQAPLDKLMQGLNLESCLKLTNQEDRFNHLIHNTTYFLAIADYMNRFPVFETLEQDFQQIHGWLSRNESRALMLLAAYAPLNLPVVEIGSFKGLSTCYLSFGLALTGRGKLTAIDHFQGSPEHQLGQFEQVTEIVTTGSTFETFHNNLLQRKLWPKVIPKVMSTDIAGAAWQDPIGLLFLDAEHSFVATQHDFNLFAPHVVKGGLVAFHDVENPVWPEVRQFYDALVSQPNWLSVLAADSIRVAMKLA